MLYTSRQNRNGPWQNPRTNFGVTIFSRLFFASAFSRALAILAPGTRIYGPSYISRGLFFSYK